MTAMLGLQMRKLYAARLAIEQELGSKYVMEVCAIKYDYIASKLMTAARGFTRRSSSVRWSSAARRITE